MDDNFFENGVLFTQYLTLIFHLRYQSIKRYKKAILYLFCNIPTLSKDDIMNYLPFTISRIFLQ